MYRTQFEKINGFEYMYIWEKEGSEEVEIYGRRNNAFPFEFLFGFNSISDFTDNCIYYAEETLLYEQED